MKAMDKSTHKMPSKVRQFNTFVCGRTCARKFVAYRRYGELYKNGEEM